MSAATGMDGTKRKTHDAMKNRLDRSFNKPQRPRRLARGYLRQHGGGMERHSCRATTRGADGCFPIGRSGNGLHPQPQRPTAPRAGGGVHGADAARAVASKYDGGCAGLFDQTAVPCRRNAAFPQGAGRRAGPLRKGGAVAHGTSACFGRRPFRLGPVPARTAIDVLPLPIPER